MSLLRMIASVRMPLIVASVALTLSIFLLAPATPLHAQGAAPLLDRPMSGCYDVAIYGVGMFGVGSATLDIPTPSGPIAAAYIEWVGAEDTTPGGLTLDGVSQLTINGVDVDGKLAEPLVLDDNGVLQGNAGYDPRAFSSAGPTGWFAWHANIGPDGPYGIVPTSPDESGFTLTIDGWTSPSDQTNGASVTLIYETGDCEVENEIRFLAGVNWYHHQADYHEFSELLIYPVEPADHARAVRMYFSHAGTDKNQTACRGGAVWMVADDGTQPMPTDPEAFDIIAIGDTDDDGIARGYGINGGVEILNDPFTSAALPCTPNTQPVPDEPYAPGHPYPNGIADAPFRVLNIEPAIGGDVGEPGEWGVLEATILLPPRARWVAFQLESEPDQNGESGSWVGGGVFLVEPDAILGDRAWEDVNGNGLQDDGEPSLPEVEVVLRDETGATIESAVTNATGFYEFTGLAGGTYSLQFTAPDDYRPTVANVPTGSADDMIDSDADPVTGVTEQITLQRREVDLSWDAGFFRPVALGDFVWLDVNENGLQDGDEQGIGGVAVTLAGAGPDDVFSTADDITRSTSTAGLESPSIDLGRYRFDMLPPGRYVVTFTLPSGYAFTLAGVGDDAVDSDADPVTGATRVVTLVSGETIDDLDAGLVLLAGAIQVEKSPDNQQVPYGESAEFTISVFNSGVVDLFDVRVTDELAPACSAVIGDLAVGERVTYACVQAGMRTDTTNTVVVTAEDIIGRPVASQDDAHVDVLPAIRVDKRADPLMVPEAGGLVTFTVQVENVVEETLTLTSLVDDIHGDLDGQGDCSVPQTIAPGTAYICAFQVVVVPGLTGERDTVVAIATDDEGNPAQDDDDALVMPEPPAPTNSGIGDFVWHDVDANGVQDTNEAGAPGIRVTLFEADGNLVAETTTDGDGKYAFTNLAAGDYYLTFSVIEPGPFAAFSPFRQGSPLLDSDVTPESVSGKPPVGSTDVFTLPPDFIDNSLDAGLTVPTAIEGSEPTAIELVAFRALTTHSDVMLTWETSAEQDTNGFHIYRSTSTSRLMAARITNEIVPAQGVSGGRYTFSDAAVLPGITYYYWLVEVENGVEAAESGPVRSRLMSNGGIEHTIYLPSIVVGR